MAAEVSRFADRRDAGRRLAARLEALREEDPVVLGVSRGGIPVAHAVAVSLAAPLDAIIVRKLGLPHQPEVGYGVLGEDGDAVVDNRIVDRYRLTDREMRQIEQHARHDLLGQSARLRAVRPRLPLLDRTALIVDDGIVTGLTMRAACREVRERGASRVVVAVPVADPCAFPLPEADEVICLVLPTHLGALGRWYRHFEQVTDEEVTDCLCRAARHLPYPAPPRQLDEPPPLRDEPVRVETADADVFGQLTVPAHPIGTVVFAQACADGRFSPRTRYIAGRLNRAHLATLSADLLTPGEALSRDHVFGLGTLTRRLVATTRWVTAQPELTGLPVGYLGAGTSAAAVLRAATDPAVTVAAIVCRAGRPDLTGPAIADVRAPTLFIVGGTDRGLLEAGRRAAREMSCETLVRVIPDASSHCTEPGAMTQVADYVRGWMIDKFTADPIDAEVSRSSRRNMASGPRSGAVGP